MFFRLSLLHNNSTQMLTGQFLIVKYTSGGLHSKGFRREVFAMTRAAQTKASYQHRGKTYAHALISAFPVCRCSVAFQLVVVNQ